jgi:hypothetical protein
MAVQNHFPLQVGIQIHHLIKSIGHDHIVCRSASSVIPSVSVGVVVVLGVCGGRGDVEPTKVDADTGDGDLVVLELDTTIREAISIGIIEGVWNHVVLVKNYGAHNLFILEEVYFLK